jgi:thymidylate synthase
MQIIHSINVNDAFAKGLALLRRERAEQDSRAGRVVVAPCPIVTEYAHPQQRVLFDPVRDANPFFHLFESLWMLGGRDDATWLDTYVKDFSKRYAEDDGQMHGAYGARWRQHFRDVQAYRKGGCLSSTLDQINIAVERLKADPIDRRVVIQMWDPTTDLGVDAKDIPCNLCIVPRIRVEDHAPPNAQYEATWTVLDITVMCRSNDAIWGAYGANAVHFSMLQEYMAAKLGVGVGIYYQISNNFHAYIDVLDKQTEPIHRDFIDDPYRLAPKPSVEGNYTSIYGGLRPVTPMPLLDSIDGFDEDLRRFLSRDSKAEIDDYDTPFFNYVVQPMHRAHFWHLQKKYDEALFSIEKMPANNDWRAACNLWLRRRQNALKRKEYFHR